MSSLNHDLSHLSVLALFAHPDDEGFGSGGTLAMLARGGARVTLVCATNGDVGEISDPALAAPENLGQVRQEELRRAMAVTGVTDVRFLNYRDSGMAGTADNEHPESLHQADPTSATERIVRIIRQVQPRVVITHDPSGGYGHPDHQAVCRHSTAAFQQAGSADAYPEHFAGGLTAWAPELLYYVCFPRRNFQRLWRKMQEMNIAPPFASQDLDQVGTPDDEVTTTLDVTAYVDTKIESLNCHQTQLDPNGPFAQLPEVVTWEIMSTEYYTLARPVGAGPEQDLLAQL